MGVDMSFSISNKYPGFYRSRDSRKYLDSIIVARIFIINVYYWIFQWFRFSIVSIIVVRGIYLMKKIERMKISKEIRKQIWLAPFMSRFTYLSATVQLVAIPKWSNDEEEGFGFSGLFSVFPVWRISLFLALIEQWSISWANLSLPPPSHLVEDPVLWGLHQQPVEDYLGLILSHHHSHPIFFFSIK